MGCCGEVEIPPGIADAWFMERWRARVLHGLIEPSAGHEVAGQKQRRGLHGRSRLSDIQKMSLEPATACFVRRGTGRRSGPPGE
jgi:hypothetical protein